MRADFYGHCAAHARLARLVGANQVLVGPMRRDELQRAIEEPARRVGLRVEPSLTEALIADVLDQPGGLPLLSAALLEQWREREGSTMRRAAYERTGGVRGAVGRLAEQTYAGLSEPERRAARGILMRLADAGDHEAAFVRRRMPLDELDLDRDEHTAAALEALVDSRLVTARDETLEVAHEALLREWPRLRGWLEEDADGRRLHQHLTNAARDWQQGGRDRGELYRGARLASTLDWVAGARGRAERARARLPRREPRRGRARARAPAAREPPPARAARRAGGAARGRAGRRRRRPQPARRGPRRGARRRRPAARRRGAEPGAPGPGPAVRARGRGARRVPRDPEQPAVRAPARSGDARGREPRLGHLRRGDQPGRRADGDRRRHRQRRRVRRRDPAAARAAVPDRGRDHPERPLLARRRHPRGQLLRPQRSRGERGVRSDRSTHPRAPAAPAAAPDRRARELRLRRRPSSCRTAASCSCGRCTAPRRTVRRRRYTASTPSPERSPTGCRSAATRPASTRSETDSGHVFITSRRDDTDMGGRPRAAERGALLAGRRRGRGGQPRRAGLRARLRGRTRPAARSELRTDPAAARQARRPDLPDALHARRPDARDRGQGRAGARVGRRAADDRRALRRAQPRGRRARPHERRAHADHGIAGHARGPVGPRGRPPARPALPRRQAVRARLRAARDRGQPGRANARGHAQRRRGRPDRHRVAAPPPRPARAGRSRRWRSTSAPTDACSR